MGSYSNRRSAQVLPSRLLALCGSSLVLGGGCRLGESAQEGELRHIGAAVCAIRSEDVRRVMVEREGRKLAVPIGRKLSAAVAERDVWFDTECSVDVREGDVPEPFGDGIATHVLMMSSDRGAELVPACCTL